MERDERVVEKEKEVKGEPSSPKRVAEGPKPPPHLTGEDEEEEMHPTEAAEKEVKKEVKKVPLPRLCGVH